MRSHPRFYRSLLLFAAVEFMFGVSSLLQNANLNDVLSALLLGLPLAVVASMLAFWGEAASTSVYAGHPTPDQASANQKKHRDDLPPFIP